jgi:hypothetical protein
MPSSQYELELRTHVVKLSGDPKLGLFLVILDTWKDSSNDPADEF